MTRDQDQRAPEHEHYLQLCALSTSGDLSASECEELRRHLDKCVECSERMEQYGDVFTSGMASLFGHSMPVDEFPAQSWSQSDAKEKLFSRIAGSDGAQGVSTGVPSWFRLRRTFAYGIPLSLAVLCTAAGFWWGFQKGRNEQPAVLTAVPARSGELTRLMAERDALNKQLEMNARTIDQLSASVRERGQKVAELRESQASEVDRYRSLAVREHDEAGQLTAVQNERNSLSANLAQTTNSLRDAQTELAGLRSQHQQDLLHSASLEARIADLRDREQQANRTVDAQEQYLASDRDIRELMGARNLYIVDVFDVDTRGQMKKAFGRMFYTKEKSLIFYAFDLDQQRGVHNAAFQAWGRKATGYDAPLNMGIFYLDNEANRRWVLKFDDPEKLEQIDSVYVTVEPKGGSRRPSGKQLLYASLRTRPNHP